MDQIVSVLSENGLLFYFFAAVIGLLIGSFINVVILRTPPMLEYLWKKDYAEYTESTFDLEKPPGIGLARSHCSGCKKQLASWHNIPVISYLLLRGKCHFCKEKISIRYPFIELLTALLTWVLAFKFGFGVAFFAACLMLWILIVIAWIDIDTFLIPDHLSLSLLWLGLFFSTFEFSILPQASILGAIIGYLVLWTVFHLFKLATGKEGMGYGDFKLLAAGGAWLGPELLIAVLFIASASGLLFVLVQKVLKKFSNKIPFGPYLAVGILASYLFDEQIINYLFPEF